MTVQALKRLISPAATAPGVVRTVATDHLIIDTAAGPTRYPPQPGLRPGDQVTITAGRILAPTARPPATYQV